MKKIYQNKSLLTLLAILVTGTAAANVSNLPGSGTEDEPYLIATYDDLRSISADLTAVYSLTADINAYMSKWDDQYVWTPIGNQTTPFTGKLYGHGHTISHLYINTPSLINVGLFGYTNGATIDSVGVLQGDITASGAAGLLVGMAKSTTVNSSYATGIIKAGINVGGLIGFNNATTVTNCYANTEIFGGTGTVGGLVGTNNYASTISGSYSTGTIHFLKPASAIGGLTGFLNGTIVNSYSRTNLVTDSVISAPALGGLVGIAMSSTITNAYSTGKIQGTFTVLTNVGGALGLNPNSLTKGTGLFWDSELSGITTVNGIATAKTTAELKSAATYSTYDFVGIWKIGTINDGYPTLAWQTADAPSDVKHIQQSLEGVRIAQTGSGFELGTNDQSLLNSEVRVYSLTGREVYRSILTSDRMIVEIPAGHYIGKLTTKQNKTVRFKALVK